MASFTVTREVNLPVEKVWSLIGDFAATPGPDIRVEVEEEGDSTGAGVGAIRKITIGRIRLREILDAANPPHSFRYRIIGGAPMKEYRGQVNFEDIGGATKIHWRADLTPAIPFTGAVVVRVAKGCVKKLIDSVEKNHLPRGQST